MLHWFFCKEFEDAQEQAPKQVPNHDKFVDTQTTLWPSLIIRRTNVHLDSCSLTIAHALLPGDHCSLLSLVRWYVAELTVKWRSTDRLLSPMRTYCVLGYLLLEPRWSPHPPSQCSIFAPCVAAHKCAELYQPAMMLPYFQH